MLVGILRPQEQRHISDAMEELARLTETAGAHVKGSITQRVRRVDPSTFVGSGKVAQIRTRGNSLGAEVIIFDADLSPAQIRNLEEKIELKVIDRSELILDIFATHARSRQAKIQVELAQLEYTLPRLTRMWTHLSRIEGGVAPGGGIGTRGPGEKQLETDRRVVRRRLRDLRDELDQIEERRRTEVSSRSEEFTVSLVGYTNAGKSTLMNALTGADALVEDKLFSTLDTKTRIWHLDGHLKALLSDTVGFIRNLPHHLIASFHATLEEASQADLLLHVVDVSHVECQQQIASVIHVLEEIGCSQKPLLMILNKVDALRDRGILDYLRAEYPNHAVTSATQGIGLSAIRNRVAEFIEASRVEVELICSAADGRLRAFVSSKGELIEEHYDERGGTLRALLPARYLEKVRLLCQSLRVLRAPKIEVPAPPAPPSSPEERPGSMNDHMTNDE